MPAAPTLATIGEVTLIAIVVLIAALGVVLAVCAVAGVVRGILDPDPDEGLDNLETINRTRW